MEKKGKGDIKFGDLSYPSLLMAGWWWYSAVGTEREGRNKRGGKEWREDEERWRSERELKRTRSSLLLLIRGFQSWV